MSTEPLKVPLSRCSLGEEEVAAVAEVIRSGWITTGPKCKQFEEDFAVYVGAKKAVAVQHGTSALFLCLQELHLPLGSEVILPALTWPSAVAAALYLGLKPVLADVDERSLNISAEAIRGVLTPRSKAIVPVHFAGLPYDEASVAKLCAERNVTIIDDNAHAAGALYAGKHVGSHALAACYSFHPIKNMTTGEGGMITTDDEAFEAKIRGARLLGVNRDAWKRYGSQTSATYDITVLSLKHNLTDMQAAMGIVQLQKLDRLNVRRRTLAERYVNQLAGLNGVILPDPGDAVRSHCWHIFTVRTADESGPRGRNEVVAKLAERGISTGIHFISVPDLTYYREALHLDPAATPVSVRAGRTILSIPLYPDMTEAEQSAVITALKAIFT